ncbi:MAG: hypothetical protein E6J34_03610 [Chloroflexi bacterium]|nr:MAG: hypothetical protein E6J34_03610 [Chloroflexota bacterium]
MKLSGKHKFKASSAQVFRAILNPDVLKSCIPGCSSVEYVDANRLRASITTQLPGLKGPYMVVINIANRQEPSHLELQVQRKGTGGSINSVSQINLQDEAGSALLTYSANAELEGPISMANNPIGKTIVESSLNSFFKNLDKAIS